MLEKEEVQDKAGDKIKAMLTYVHEHYGERLTVAELAASAFISEREAYRVFRECVHLTPVEYIISYRLAAGLPYADRNGGTDHPDQPGLLSGKQQLFRKSIP